MVDEVWGLPSDRLFCTRQKLDGNKNKQEKINFQVAKLSCIWFFTALPINNFLLMQKLESQDYAGCVKPSKEEQLSGKIYENQAKHLQCLETRLIVTHCAVRSGKTSSCMRIIRSPPGVYSITKQAWWGVWKHANMFTRNGWSEELTTSNIRFSQFKLPRFKELKCQC